MVERRAGLFRRQNGEGNMAYGRRRAPARRTTSRRTSYSRSYTRKPAARRSSGRSYAARKPRRVNRSVRSGSRRAAPQTIRIEVVQQPAGNPLADRLQAAKKPDQPRKSKF